MTIYEEEAFTGCLSREQLIEEFKCLKMSILHNHIYVLN